MTLFKKIKRMQKARSEYFNYINELNKMTKSEWEVLKEKVLWEEAKASVELSHDENKS